MNRDTERCVTWKQRRCGFYSSMQQINYVALDDFVNDILPRSYIAKASDLDLVIQQLKQNLAFEDDDVTENLSRGPWNINEAEVKPYAHLANTINAISKAAFAVATDADPDFRGPRYLEYVNNNPATQLSSNRDDASRPDGFFVVKNRSASATPPEVHWCDIAVVAEFNEVNNSRTLVNNFDKMLWSLHHLMRDDPCRDFAYGFTIEDTSVKMWYCDRSNIVISDEFDIHKDRKMFLTFCLSMLYASIEELGWDTSIARLGPMAAAQPVQQLNSEDYRYVLSVRAGDKYTRRFITTSPISSHGAYGIFGRGTRVWEARELLDNGKESEEVVAVKDYWIDADRDREGDVVKGIMDAAPDDVRRAKLKNHIIDILCHGDVYRERVGIVRRDGATPEMLKETVPDSTRDLREAIRRRDRSVCLECLESSATQFFSRSSDSLSGASPPIIPSACFNTAHRTWQPLPGVRTRNRIVMRQIGKPLHAETSLRAVFKGLRDVCTGLHMIHKYGWVHRDVSTGNIILWQGKGILTDFEYARRIPDEGDMISAPHDREIGTPHFMAVEVQSDQYCFISDAGISLDVGSRQRRPSSSSSSSVSSLPETSSTIANDDNAISDEEVPFFHNPMHDFESLMWIGNYFIFNRTVDDPARRQSHEDLAAQRAYARLLFSGDLHVRRTVFDSIRSNKFHKQLRCLHPSVRGIGGFIKTWIRMTKAMYVNLEHDIGSIASSTIKMKIGSHVKPCLKDILKILKKGDVKVKHLPVEKVVGVRL